MFENKTSYNSKANEKILKVLKKMDEVLCKNGYYLFQERLHRISKTLLSTERLESLFVSRFSFGGDEETKEDTREEETKMGSEAEASFASNYNSVISDNRIEIENEDNTVTKIQLDDLLGYIEEQLSIKHLVSSSEEENKVPVDKKNEDKLERRFFNIQHRLKTFLKQEQNFLNNYDSFFEDSRIKTPCSKMSAAKSVLPTIRKNFFFQDSCKISRAAQKRYSLKDSLFNEQVCPLGNAEEVFKCKSNLEGIFVKSQDKAPEANNNVSNFTIFDIDGENMSHMSIEDSHNSSHFASSGFHFNKRNSIFNGKFQLDLLEESKFNMEEFDEMSEKSNERSSSDEN